MATGVSGSMSTNASTYIVADVDYSETYDVATNASSVTASLWYKRTNSYAYATISPGNFYVKINGTDYLVYSGTFTIPGNDNNWHKVGEKTVTGIAHNADGSKSITIGGSHSTTATNVAYLNFNLSKSVALTTIPRASKPSASKSAVTLDGSDSVVINTNRASSSFTHTLAITVGGHTVTVNNVGASYTWVPGVAYWMPYMTSKSMTVTVSCTTYNGSTQIGSAQSTSFTLNVNTAVYHPAILSIEHSDINEDTVALETDGTYIKGFSNLSLSTNVTVNSADYGSLVQTVTITHNGISRVYTNSLGVIEFEVAYSTIVGADSIVIKVTDNRGVKVSQTVNLTVIPYDVPKLSAIEIKRVNANNQESETGVYLKYKLASTVFWGSFGQVNNALTIYSRSKLPSAQNYSAWSLEQTISTSGTAQYKSYEITGTCAGEYSSSTQFDVQIKVEDELGNAVLYAKVLEGIPVFAWGPDHFDVYGSVHIHDREDVMKYITLDSDPVEVVPVTFNGAVGGSVNWTVFKFGKLRIATCRWRAASNYTINQQWGSWYYCPNINTPNFPVAFNLVTYQNIRYVGADNGATYTAFAEMNIQVADSSGNTTKTNMGSLNLYRPDSGATVGHPVFTQIVIGTIS